MTSNQWGPTQHTIRSKNSHAKNPKRVYFVEHPTGIECVEYHKNPHAVALGRAGGKVKSEAKAAAARENGKKGGRPKQKSPR